MYQLWASVGRAWIWNSTWSLLVIHQLLLRMRICNVSWIVGLDLRDVNPYTHIRFWLVYMRGTWQYSLSDVLVLFTLYKHSIQWTFPELLFITVWNFCIQWLVVMSNLPCFSTMHDHKICLVATLLRPDKCVYYFEVHSLNHTNTHPLRGVSWCVKRPTLIYVFLKLCLLHLSGVMSDGY